MSTETHDAEVIDGEAVEESDLPAAPLPALPERPTALVARDELSVEDLVGQMQLIEQAMTAVMKPNVHYGTIPGTDKPTLYQPGAQKLNVLFRLAPSFQTERTWHDDGHLTVVSTCLLTHITTGLLMGTGDGLCSTKESRYAHRNAQRVCPRCGEAQIKRSKFAPKEGDYEGASPSDEPGWYCWKKEGGCGANFAAGDQAITSQETGKIDNPDIADLYNTVLKMANKRALVAATINATAASDVFTQDVEDNPPEGGGSPVRQQAERAQQAQQAGPQPAPEATWHGPATLVEFRDRFARALGSDAEAVEWIRQLLEQGYGARWADLSAEQKREASVWMTSALHELETTEGDLAFAENHRDVVAGAFKAATGGTVIIFGPEWRLTPAETNLPTEAEWKEAQNG